MELAYQDERDIIALTAQIADAEVCFFPEESDLGHRYLASLRSGELTQRERPDFEDTTKSLLLEVMRVDDHPRPGKKDATRAQEGRALRELRDAGFGDIFPNAKLVTNVTSGLPTKQDHNYRAYVDHFTSVVARHSRNEAAYRAERPGFELGFLVFDESTAYFESYGSFGLPISGSIHYWWQDVAFLDTIAAVNVDCFMWLTPYKGIEATSVGKLRVPGLTVIDVGLVRDAKPRTYDAARMESSEV